MKKAGKKDARFVCTYTQGNSFTHMNEIWVDKKTGVNYLFHAYGYASGLTPLLNPDGTPVVTPISRWEKE